MGTLSRLGLLSAATLAIAAVYLRNAVPHLPAPATGPAQALAAEYDIHTLKLQGSLAKNEHLLAAQLNLQGQVQSAESLALAPDGSIAIEARNGSIWRATRQPDGGLLLDAKPLACLKSGRPLGLHYDVAGNLNVCNAGEGLQQIAKDTHKVTTLATHTSAGSDHPGSVIAYANDLDIASDGTIYFSDSTHIPPMEVPGVDYPNTLRSCVLALAQGVASGRLLAYSPNTKHTSVVMDGLLFANGVAMAHDGSFVAVVDTGAWKVWKFHLRGPKVGTRELMFDSLPGFPDGISRAADGKTYWLSIVNPPNLLSALLKYRWARWAIAWAPKPLQKMPDWGCILRVTGDGQVLESFMDPNGKHLHSVSSILDAGDQLFLGNLFSDSVASLKL